MTQPDFLACLFDCDDGSSLTTSNGSRFIRKLPDERLLGYLHKFYAPFRGATEAALIQRLPPVYVDFLRWANGASLFDNCISLFGYVEQITRETAPDAVTAISLNNDNDLFALMEARRWEDGWTKIGSVVGWNSSYTLELHREGRCAVIGGETSYTAVTFDECIHAVITRVSPCFTCEGIIDSSYGELEAALASLFRLH
ncbi:MAG: SMI1/KNR4 family protein [Pseudomonadota bacterium]